MIKDYSLENREKFAEYMKGKNYIAYFLSSMEMGREAGELEPYLWENMDELLEAYIFNEEEAVHIFDYEGDRKAVHYIDKGEQFFTEMQLLRDKGMKALEVASYIGFDEFNQAYVKYKRPYGFMKEG